MCPSIWDWAGALCVKRSGPGHWYIFLKFLVGSLTCCIESHVFYEKIWSDLINPWTCYLKFTVCFLENLEWSQTCNIKSTHLSGISNLIGPLCSDKSIFWSLRAVLAHVTFILLYFSTHILFSLALVILRLLPFSETPCFLLHMSTGDVFLKHNELSCSCHNDIAPFPLKDPVLSSHVTLK